VTTRNGWPRAAAGAALLALATVPSGTATASQGRCAAGTGVTVVVDYGPMGGVVIGCDPDGAGKSAAEVVTDAGFSLEYVSSQPGFVCRVNGHPGKADEDCADTPPSDAYWGLFWSDADPETWAYSSEGAGSLDVPEGGSIGWRFQDGGDREVPSAPPTSKAKSPSPHPSTSPQPAGPSDAASPTPTPTPSASVPPGGGGSTTSPGEKADRSRPDGREGAADQPSTEPKDKGDKGDQGGKDKKGKHPDEKARPDQAAAPSPSVSTAALSPASSEPLTDDDSSTGLTLVAGGAVLLLAGAAGVIAWRRRG